MQSQYFLIAKLDEERMTINVSFDATLHQEKQAFDWYELLELYRIIKFT